MKRQHTTGNDTDVCGVCGLQIRLVPLVGKWIHDSADYDPFDDPHAPKVAEWDTHEEVEQ